MRTYNALPTSCDPFISVLALFDPWSGSTWTVLDSPCKVVHRNM